MSYRYRLGTIPKTVKTDIQDLSFEEVCEKYKIQNPIYELPEFEELYELGKCFDYDEKQLSNFFSFELEENHFHIVSK